MKRVCTVGLKWRVSLDGKRTQSETYKIIAVLDKSALSRNLGKWAIYAAF